MGVRVTSLSGFGFGLGWEFTKTDRQVAQEAITFLEDCRLLFGVRLFEDQSYCIASAIRARRHITDLLSRGVGPDLGISLRAMRAAFRKFVDEGGPDGLMYRSRGHGGLDSFSVALGELRSTIGAHVATLAYHYELEVEEELATIIPAMPSLEDDLLG